MNRSAFMKLAMSVCAVLVTIATAQIGRSARSDDEWRMRRSDDSGKVHFSLERTRPGSRWSHSSDVPVANFEGLSLDALSKGGPAKFQFVHDAATLACEGHFTNGRGIGTFQLVPNPRFSAELQRLGYEAPADDQLFSMVMSDVSLEFARGVKDAGLQATTKQLVELRIHGVTTDYIQRMQASGYPSLTARDFVEMKIHGVTPELVAELKRAGYDVPAKKVVEMKIHGVTPEYIAELNTYGLKPGASEIVEMRIHGVKPEFLRDAKELGYSFTSKELTQMRIHGVDGSYLRKLRDSGFKDLTADKIVKLRIHGID